MKRSISELAKKNNDKRDEAKKTGTVPEKDIKTAERAEAEAEKTEPEKAAEDKKTEPEIPESITLTKEEFGKVKDRIDKLEKDRADAVALMQRVQADFDNYRKRNATIAADCLEEGSRNVIKSLLPVLDNFDRAMEALPEGSWTEGIKLVNKQFYDILQKNGLAEIEASGEFDPEFHEAVLQEEAEGKESGEITGVLQKGYKVKDRIIRHSMVKVAK